MFKPDKSEARLEFGPERNKWRRPIGSLLIVVLLVEALPCGLQAHLITGSPSDWLATARGGVDVPTGSDRFSRSSGEIWELTRDKQNAAAPETTTTTKTTWRHEADELIGIEQRRTRRQDKQQDLEASRRRRKPSTTTTTTPFASSADDANGDTHNSIRVTDQDQKSGQSAARHIGAGQLTADAVADSNDMEAAQNMTNQFKSVITTTATANTTSEPGETNASQQVLELSAFEAAQLGFFRHSPPVSVILTIAYSLVFILGIAGNSLVVAIVCKSPRMRTVTNYFIANLALADILVVVFCLPVTLLGNLFIPYVLGEFVCKTVSYLQGVAVSASINTMVTVTLDRFLAICFPMDWHMSRRMARCTIACIWLFSMTIALPWAMFFTLVPYPLERHTIQVCAEEWPSERMGKIYFVCANLILLYLFPAFVIIVCYLGIWYKIERRSIPGDGQKGPKIELIMQRSKLKVIKMMMLVVVIFLLSWLPLYLIFARVKLADERNSWEDALITAMMPLAQWLGASNSCINPILYTFFNKKYKHGFINLLRLIFCCRRRSPCSSSSAGFMMGAQFATSANQLGRAATNGLALEQNGTTSNNQAAWRHQNGFCCSSSKPAANKMPGAKWAQCRGSTHGGKMHRAAAMRLHSFSMDTSLPQPEDDQCELKALGDCSSGAAQNSAPPEDGHKNNKQNRPDNNGLGRRAGINQGTINGADMRGGRLAVATGELAGEKVVRGPTWSRPSDGNSRRDCSDCHRGVLRATAPSDSGPNDSNQIQAIERIPLDDRSLFRRSDQGELSVVLRLGSPQAGLEPEPCLRKQRAQTFHCGAGVGGDSGAHRNHHHHRHHDQLNQLNQLNRLNQRHNHSRQRGHGHHRRRLKTDSPRRQEDDADERTLQRANSGELQADGHSRGNQTAPSSHHDHHHQHHHHHHHHHNKHHKHHRHRHDHQARQLVASNGNSRGPDKQLAAEDGEAELNARGSCSMSTASVQLNRSASRDAATEAATTAAHHHKYHNHNRHHHHHHHHHRHQHQHQHQQPAQPLEHLRHRKETPAATEQEERQAELDGGQMRLLADGSEPALDSVARDRQTTKMSYNNQANDLGDHQIELSGAPKAVEEANRTEINAEPQGQEPT